MLKAFFLSMVPFVTGGLGFCIGRDLYPVKESKESFDKGFAQAKEECEQQKQYLRMQCAFLTQECNK